MVYIYIHSNKKKKNKKEKNKKKKKERHWRGHSGLSKLCKSVTAYPPALQDFILNTIFLFT